MNAAYVDTSCLVAIAFGEPDASTMRRRLERFDELFASNLLEAELRSVLRREGVTDEPKMLRAVTWVIPDRPLGAEMVRVLDVGYVRGGDCWHLATALYLAEDPTSLSFLTLDERQGAVASELGFPA